MLFAGTGMVLAQQPGSDPSQSSSEGDFVIGEVLVKFEEGTSKAKKGEVHKKKGGRTKEVIGGIDVEVVAVDRGKEKFKAKEYQNDPNVEYAEVNGVYEAVAAAEPNDPRATDQWGFNNANDADIDAYEAWNGGSSTAWNDGTTGSSSVAIAILDTGINEDHEDLMGKVIERKNFNPNSGTTDDEHGHGTHVAGSAAAVTNNATGVAGTCPGCTLLNGKVLDDSGKGSDATVAKGIFWASGCDVARQPCGEPRAKVINMSLGGGDSTTLQEAVDKAWGNGVVLVAAAGNSGSRSLLYPAAYANVIAVAATDSSDAKASFSNYGASWVDVAAPGVSILSTQPNGNDKIWGDATGSYGTISGTSVASPHVAGTAGLVWSKAGLCADYTCVRDQLESTTDQIGGTGSYWAKGRINANRSITTPRIAQTSPLSGDVGVARSSDITATFSEEMDQSTLTSTNVKLYERVRKRIRRHGKVRRVWRWVPVSAEVGCGNTCQTVTLDPYGTSETLLDPYRSHLVVISTGVKDADEVGNALARNYSWTFTTGAS